MRYLNDSDTESDHFDILPFIAVMLIVLATLLFVTMVMASINVGIGAGEGWIPIQDKSTDNKTPVLVEWDGEKLYITRATGKKIIYLGSNKNFWWNKTNHDLKNVELLEFMNIMKSQVDNSYVLFAVRPSGFANFQALAAEFRAKGINIGYEPVEQGKSIKLMKD